MKKALVISAVSFLATILVVGGLFILPTLQLKSGLDRLAASLPHGMRFTYEQARYSLFTRTVTLKNASIHIDPYGIIVDIGKIRVEGGNADFEKALNQAMVSPNPGDAVETPVADKIVVENVHSAMNPVDFSLGRAEIDRPRLSLRQLTSPLQPLASPRPARFDKLLQQVGMLAMSSAYAHASLEGAVLTGADPDTGDKAIMKIARLDIDKFDHGDLGQTTLDGLEIGSGDVAMTVDHIVAGDVNHRDFWKALRDGAPIDLAAEKFQGASQTIEALKMTDAGKQIGSIDKIGFTNLGYHAGVLTSLDLAVDGMAVDPTALPYPFLAKTLPELGYQPARLQGRLVFAWNLPAKSIRFDPVTVTLEKGGNLALSATLANAGPDTPMTRMKVQALTLRYADKSLVSGWLAYTGKRTGKGTDKIKDIYAGWVEEQKPAFRRDPPLQAALDQIAAFIRTPHTLTIALNPPTPTGLSDFDPKNPQSFSARMGLKVTAQ